MRGKDLKLKRESLALTESEMAERLGLSIERYRSWEGDREALGDEIRGLLRLAVEKVEIDIDFEKRQSETAAVLARAREVLASSGTGKPIV
ncbi:MAG: hypothetical protein L0220_26025 [Acidobacteria bacterium]|nr:hypothetical protein [Acidobacteriota bacterium]